MQIVEPGTAAAIRGSPRRADEHPDLVVFDADSHTMRPVRDPVAALVNRAETRDIRAVVHEGRVVYGRLQ